MLGARHCMRFVLVCAVMGIAPAAAQESLEAGKTAPQLFASDCAICHKTPQGLARSSGAFGLSAFLRQHYTSSRETAAALASYLEAVGNAPPAPVRRTSKPPTPKPKERAKTDDKATSGSKADDGKPAESKASTDKPADTKPPAASPAAKPEGSD